MVTLRFVNVDAGTREFETVEEAVAAAKRFGFESVVETVVESERVMLATFSPLYGVRVWFEPVKRPANSNA